MYRKLADTIILDFTVHLPTTGAVSDADALPTVEIWEDETDTTLAGGTVTKRVGKTGNYRVAVVATAANGFEVGKSYNVVVTVVAGGVTAKAVVGSFFIDGKRLSDLNDIAAGTVMGKSPATLAAADVSGNIAADIQTIKAQAITCAAGVTVNPNVGMTQPINFTGTGANALVQSDVTDWKGAAAPAMTGDAFARLGAAGAGLTALGDTRIANLDAAVSSRSTLTAQQVWEYATRTLSSFGTLVADIWANATRTLSSFGTLAADIWTNATRSLTDKAGFSISGTTATLDALAILLRGADNDTLKTLSDQLDLVALEATLTAIKGSGWATETLKAIKAAIPIQGATKAELDVAQAAIEAAIDDITGLDLSGLALEASVQAVKGKTDLLPADPASESAVEAAIAVISEPDLSTILTAIGNLNDITVGQLLAGDLGDGVSFPADSLADRLRKLFWVVCNRLVIEDETGDFTAYKGDGATPGVTGNIEDNGVTTERSTPTWP